MAEAIQDDWWECDECIFASNSTKQAIKHEETTGHMVYSEEEDPE